MWLRVPTLLQSESHLYPQREYSYTTTVSTGEGNVSLIIVADKTVRSLLSRLLLVLSSGIHVFQSRELHFEITENNNCRFCQSQFQTRRPIIKYKLSDE